MVDELINETRNYFEKFVKALENVLSNVGFHDEVEDHWTFLNVLEF